MGNLNGVAISPSRRDGLSLPIIPTLLVQKTAWQGHVSGLWRTWARPQSDGHQRHQQHLVYLMVGSALLRASVPCLLQHGSHPGNNAHHGIMLGTKASSPPRSWWHRVHPSGAVIGNSRGSLAEVPSGPASGLSSLVTPVSWALSV